MKLIVSLFVVTLAACGGKSIAPPPTAPIASATPDAAPAATATTAASCAITGGTAADVDCAIAMMGKYADQVCACTSADCANGVTTEMSKWISTTSPMLETAEPDKDQMARMDTISDQYEGCMRKTGADGAGSAAN